MMVAYLVLNTHRRHAQIGAYDVRALVMRNSCTGWDDLIMTAIAWCACIMPFKGPYSLLWEYGARKARLAL